MIKPTTRVGHVQLAQCLSGFIGLAPAAHPSVRRTLGRKASNSDYVWLVRDGRTVRALVALDTLEILWELPTTWDGTVEIEAKEAAGLPFRYVAKKLRTRDNRWGVWDTKRKQWDGVTFAHELNETGAQVWAVTLEERAA